MGFIDLDALKVALARPCAVDVGHTGSNAATWRDTLTGMVVCDRHRSQYDERDDFGPYRWESLR